ncbi:uncharacterized protein LOC122093079 [Macadamia integrifolia]|uniref:uncharacterized protein LOC122093079 n=1 Tax=Macadamia integrifolia TaxID=60698 RepID=UPI001C52EF5D|nr:uncharacterized protein LOC122093079 [Macadamia integrifolia]
MKAELQALDRNRTWELVRLPDGKRTVGCHWIYKIKYNSDESIERYKARLVAKGKLSAALIRFGFKRGESDSSMFTKNNDQGIVIVLVVDDLVITGSNRSGIDALKHHLSREFDIKDLGRGILMKNNGHTEIVGYTDADWARSPMDRKSTTGFCTFVGGNIVT